MVTSPGSGLFSHQRFLTVLRFQPVAVKMSRYKASVLPNPSFTISFEGYLVSPAGIEPAISP